MLVPAVCEADARGLDAEMFSGKFRNDVSDELFDNVFDELLDNMVDELSDEVFDELISDLLLAFVGSGSSSRDLLFPSSRLRYLFCHDAFSSFNFVTSL